MVLMGVGTVREGCCALQSPREWETAVSGAHLSPQPLALVMSAEIRSPAFTAGQRGSRLGGSVTLACGKETYVAWTPSRMDTCGEKLQPGLGGRAGQCPPREPHCLGWALLLAGVPTCLAPALTPRLHKELPGQSHGGSFPSGVWGLGDPTADAPAWGDPACFLSVARWSLAPPGALHTQAHCHHLREVSGLGFCFHLSHILV